MVASAAQGAGTPGQRPVGLLALRRCRPHAGPVGVVRVPLRFAAVSLAVSGLSWAIASPFHPSIFDGDVAGVVQRTDGWVAIHLFVMVGSAAAIPGVAGIVAAHRGQLGREGEAVLLGLGVGAVITAAIMFTEALVFPRLAADAPHLLELDGPLLGGIGPRLLIGLGGAHPIGLIVLGVLCARSDLAPRAGRALVASIIAFLAFGVPFVPIAGVLATTAYGAAHLWWAQILWSAAGDRRSLTSSALEVVPSQDAPGRERSDTVTVLPR